MKDSEKIDKYMDLARELKKLWKMKVTVIRNVISAFRIVPKAWKRNWWNWRYEKKIKTIQTTDLLRSTIILKRVLET